MFLWDINFRFKSVGYQICIIQVRHCKNCSKHILNDLMISNIHPNAYSDNRSKEQKMKHMDLSDFETGTAQMCQNLQKTKSSL